MENYFGPSVDYGYQHGVLVNFWGAGRGKPLYSVGVFRWFNQRLAYSFIFNKVGVGKKIAKIKSRKIFNCISFWRIYQNRRDVDVVCRDCLLRPWRALGPLVGDLPACSEVCVAGVVVALSSENCD